MVQKRCISLSGFGTPHMAWRRTVRTPHPPQCGDHMHDHGQHGGFYQGRTAPHRTCCHAQRNVAQQRVCLRLQGITQVDKASKTWTRSRMRCVQAYSTWHIADECPQWYHTPHSARRARYFAAACAHNDGTLSRQPKNSTILAGKPFTGGAARERTWKTNDLNNHPAVCGRLRALCRA